MSYKHTTIIKHLKVINPASLSSFNKTKYEDIFRKMMTRLAGAQQADGLWRPSVLAPESKPFKESSGTPLMAFAFASGINQGILEKQTFLPLVSNAWSALIDACNQMVNSAGYSKSEMLLIMDQRMTLKSMPLVLFCLLAVKFINYLKIDYSAQRSDFLGSTQQNA